MDFRDRLANFGPGDFPEGAEVDSQKKIVHFELESEDGEMVSHTISFSWGVCPSCDGDGSYVNPSIDAHGISSEEFSEDPDFRESYFSGAYDITCEHCKGQRVAPKAQKNENDPAWKALKAWRKDRADMIREMESERRMGC